MICIIQLDANQVAVCKPTLLQFANLVTNLDCLSCLTRMPFFECKISVYPLPAPFITAAAAIEHFTSVQKVILALATFQ